MCCSILEELNKVKACEQERNVKLPKPYYLFVQNYGRNPETELTEIAKSFGNGKWFSFLAESQKQNVTILNRFLIESEKHAEIGKSFQGHALIELTGNEEPKELSELLNYINQNARQFQCIFTTRMLEGAEEIKNCLEQHFFVREISGKEYEAEEQSTIFLRVLVEYGFEVDQLTEVLGTMFSEIQWEETDMVQSRIENLARNIAYNKMLEPEAALSVTADEVKDALRELKKEPEVTRRIGFVRGE
ncbi:MAG: hypothetical protein IJ353_04050 [Lachnospiraceae bacterium]|nr:hypothetical protein [Lachnospiraceae bacterium]